MYTFYARDGAIYTYDGSIFISEPSQDQPPVYVPEDAIIIELEAAAARARISRWRLKHRFEILEWAAEQQG